MVELELLLDTIADRIITSTVVDQSLVLANQKTIRNGIISLGRTNADKLILFEKDVKANKEDLETSGEFDGISYTLQGMADILTENFDIVVQPADGGVTIEIDDAYGIADGFDITTLLSDGDLNPINISQFVNIDLTSSNVIPGQANEFLDTNIYELLGGGRTRQDRINDFFTEFGNLTADPPEWLLENGMVGENFSSDDYSDLYDISPTNPEGNIPRLDIDEGEDNISQTLQSLRDRLDTYLVDIDEELDTLEDQRPTYQNKSNGYLKFRDLNQGIIIRNTNQDFIEGLNPSDLTYLNELDSTNVEIDNTGTGFTITMWVRFLDKVSEGTLFNFGNPTRGYNGLDYTEDYVDDDAFGFTLETFVLNKDDETGHQADNNTWGDVSSNITNYNSADAFNNSNTARFVRLVVNDNGQLRDSTVGFEMTSNHGQKLNNTIPFKPEITQEGTEYTIRLFGSTFIPENFSEWYFICASFNPAILEDDSHDTAGANEGENLGNSTLEKTPEYWLNHMKLDSTFTNLSDYGNRCKVEIISRSDLLRARGFKG